MADALRQEPSSPRPHSSDAWTSQVMTSGLAEVHAPEDKQGPLGHPTCLPVVVLKAWPPVGCMQQGLHYAGQVHKHVAREEKPEGIRHSMAGGRGAGRPRLQYAGSPALHVPGSTLPLGHVTIPWMTVSHTWPRVHPCVPLQANPQSRCLTSPISCRTRGHTRRGWGPRCPGRR